MEKEQKGDFKVQTLGYFFVIIDQGGGTTRSKGGEHLVQSKSCPEGDTKTFIQDLMHLQITKKKKKPRREKKI